MKRIRKGGRSEACCRDCAMASWIKRHEHRAHDGSWILMRCAARTDRAVFPEEDACPRFRPRAASDNSQDSPSIMVKHRKNTYK